MHVQLIDVTMYDTKIFTKALFLVTVFDHRPVEILFARNRLIAYGKNMARILQTLKKSVLVSHILKSLIDVSFCTMNKI